MTCPEFKSANTPDQQKPWWCDGKVKIQLAKIYYNTGKLEEFVDTIFLPVLETLNIEHENRKVHIFFLVWRSCNAWSSCACKWMPSPFLCLLINSYFNAAALLNVSFFFFCIPWLTINTTAIFALKHLRLIFNVVTFFSWWLNKRNCIIKSDSGKKK